MERSFNFFRKIVAYKGTVRAKTLSCGGYFFAIFDVFGAKTAKISCKSQKKTMICISTPIELCRYSFFAIYICILVFLGPKKIENWKKITAPAQRSGPYGPLTTYYFPKKSRARSMKNTFLIDLKNFVIIF